MEQYFTPRRQMIHALVGVLCIYMMQPLCGAPQGTFCSQNQENKRIDGTLCVADAVIQKSCHGDSTFPLGSEEKYQKTYSGKVSLYSKVFGQHPAPVAIDTFFEIPLYLDISAASEDEPHFITVESVSIVNNTTPHAKNAYAIEGSIQKNGIAAVQLSLDIEFCCSPFKQRPIVELSLGYGPDAPIDTFRTTLAPGPGITANLAEWLNIEVLTTKITPKDASIKLIIYTLLSTDHDLTPTEVNNYNEFINNIINRLSISIALTGRYTPHERQHC